MSIINVGLSIQVEGVPQIPVPNVKIEVEAYDKIEVSVKAGSDLIVDVQPGEKAVSFLLIKSSIYTSANAADDKKLTYQPDGKSAINLDNPQVSLGVESIAALLGKVQKITFSNKLAGSEGKESETAVIEVLVGRDATPTPAPSPTP
ncbi:hypothetical protein [Nostoc sp. WHI]|uniref:hypothetical protein n=1 Tax=Nostoc sp. WHI TaxID=2650611 RepID=UPI0018C7ADAA|nr:hypothetical protein [Nostoc sp. WHI]MBG1267332.1 hypothetical protein [Nostoc sp. WHI]